MIFSDDGSEIVFPERDSDGWCFCEGRAIAKGRSGPSSLHDIPWDLTLLMIIEPMGRTIVSRSSPIRSHKAHTG